MRTPLVVAATLFIANLLVLSAPAAGQGRMYLQLPGIPGEATDPKHKDWIDVSACAFDAVAVAATSPAAGAASTRPRLGNLVVTKQLDAASPQLFLDCCLGRHIATGVLEVVGQDGMPQMRISLTDVLIVSFASAIGPEDSEVETITLEYNAIAIEHFRYDATGKLIGTAVGGWDRRTGKAITSPQAGAAGGEPLLTGPAGAAASTPLLQREGGEPEPAARIIVSPGGGGDDSRGRLVMAFPEAAKITNDTTTVVTVPGKREPTRRVYGSTAVGVEPGRYDVTVSGRRLSGIEIRAGHDTRLHVGAIRLPGDHSSRIELMDESGEVFMQIRGGIDVGLPAGRYAISIDDAEPVPFEIRPGELHIPTP